MSSRKFRLEALLSYRHFLKAQAAGRLAQGAQARLEAYESLSRCEAKLSEMERFLDPDLVPRMRASDLLLIQQGIADQRRQIASANQAYTKAVEAEETLHEEVIDAQKDYEAIVKLETKHKQSVQLEGLKAEERALNEYSNARFKRTVEA